jgi:hypothetical protein
VTAADRKADRCRQSQDPQTCPLRRAPPHHRAKHPRQALLRPLPRRAMRVLLELPPIRLKRGPLRLWCGVSIVRARTMVEHGRIERFPASTIRRMACACATAPIAPARTALEKIELAIDRRFPHPCCCCDVHGRSDPWIPLATSSALNRYNFQARLLRTPAPLTGHQAGGSGRMSIRPRRR